MKSRNESEKGALADERATDSAVTKLPLWTRPTLLRIEVQETQDGIGGGGDIEGVTS